MTYPNEATTQDDLDNVRSDLIRDQGTDFGITDEELRLIAEAAKAKVRESGRRWSWNAIALDEIVRAAEESR